MSSHFNGFGVFHDRLDKARARNPKAAREWDRLSEELQEKEKFARSAFDSLGVRPDYDGLYDYKKLVIKPIEEQMDKVWKQLFCKHVHTAPIGTKRFVGGGIFDSERDGCGDCGAEGIEGLDFHRHSIPNKTANRNLVHDIP